MRSRRARSTIAPIAEEERLALVARLLHDFSVDLRDRVAGCLLLIYAQPLSRIVVLTISDVAQVDDRIELRLGPVPLELPDPLSGLALALARDPPRPVSTAVAGTGQRWLFESKRIGEPMTGGHLRRRLSRLGSGRSKGEPARS